MTLMILLVILNSLTCVDAHEDRKLQRLNRDDGAETDTSHSRAPVGNALGIFTSQYRSQGWIQDGFPKTFRRPPKVYGADELAVSTSGCSRLFDENGLQGDFPG